MIRNVSILAGLIAVLAVGFVAGCAWWEDVGDDGSDKNTGSELDQDDPIDAKTPCITVLTCREYFGRAAFCWEWGPENTCDGACFTVGTPEGTHAGWCVDGCENDDDCPDGFFCEPACREETDRPAFCVPESHRDEFTC